MLTGTWWITPFGSWNMGSAEHVQFATHFMLMLPPDRRVPTYWAIKGVPPEELEAALARGADPEAVEFLKDKRRDARLFAMQSLGWCRTARNRFNLWRFDAQTAKMIRDAQDYWQAQTSAGSHEMIDVEEFDGRDAFSISVAKLLAGGNPQVLKNLAMGRIEETAPREVVAPAYSTRKYSELERDRLYQRTGANPKKKTYRASAVSVKKQFPH